MQMWWRSLVPRRFVHRCKNIRVANYLWFFGVLLCLRFFVPHVLHAVFIGTSHFETRQLRSARNLENLRLDSSRAFNKSDTELAHAAAAGVSVVLLNWGRPELVLHTVLPALVSFKNVAQVVVSHGRRDTAYISELAIHPKILHRLDYKSGGLNAMLGVASRFEAALLDATQPWVLIMDDDILPSEEGIDQLITAMAQNPYRIVGKWGRTQHVWPFYDTVDVYGDCDVVLTKFMMLQRDAIELFFDYADILGLARGLPGSRVVWNGEDVFMSLVHRAASGHPNYALPPSALGDVAELAGAPGMSADLPKDWRALVPSGAHVHALVHWWHRSRFWAVVVDRLRRLAPMVASRA
eukprot:m.254877 g.254877  ORF g.254877 m.254877 type:complete len:352 (-) comp19607_c0_seq7:1287-2342(-)